MLRRSLTALLVLTAFTVISPTMASASSVGQFDFLRNATSSFDSTLAGSTTAQRQWMGQTYSRMRGYPPYFDQALSWAPPSDFYRDLYALYRDASVDQSVIQQHPDWVLRDSQGRALYIPSGCDGTSCPQYAADIGSPGFRAWWVSQAQNTVAKGYEGVFVDDVNMEMRVSNGAGQDVRPIDPRTGAPMTDTNWRRYIAEFCEAIRTGLPTAQITHNALWWMDQSDPYVQREIKSADTIELERGFNDGGLTQGGGTFGYETFMNHIEWLHSLGKTVISEPYNLDSAKREYEMASLYLVKVAGDSITSDFQADPSNWWAGWGTDLGTPQGSRYVWNGLWRRDFSKGFVLTNEPGAATRTVQLDGSYTRLSSGSQVSSVTLGAASGAVLIGTAQSSPPPPSDPPPTTTTPPPPTNLALNKTATSQSVEATGLEANKADDGNSGTRWSSAFADNQWWQVDLGSAQSVDTVKLNWESAYGSHYLIQTSTDGTNFTQAADVTNSGPGIKTTTFTARNARYVRVMGLTRGTQYGFSFWDAEVYGPSQPPPATTTPPPATTPPPTTTTPPPTTTTTPPPTTTTPPATTTSPPSVNHNAKRHHTKKVRPRRRRRG